MRNLTVALVWLTGAILVFQAVQTVVYRTFSPIGFSGQGNNEFSDLGAMFVFLGVAMLGGLVGLAQIIVGIIWMYRASENVTRFGITDRTFGPGWAVGAWFIPVANLVLGWFVIREIWKGSQQGVSNTDWKQVRMPAWIIAWWTFFTTSYVVSYAASGYTLVKTFGAIFTDPMVPPTPPDVYVATLASAACYIIAGVFFLRFISIIQGLQDGVGRGMPALPTTMQAL